jgi:phenylpropionate dioxygenase-like ring-hydroxylating dioxygenase large terminal subunit
MRTGFHPALSYHGWNYGLDGSLAHVSELTAWKNFERQQNGLVPVKAETWQKLGLSIRPSPRSAAVSRRIGSGWRRSASASCTTPASSSYDIHCNWKVFVDNSRRRILPHPHKGLNSVLDYKGIHHRERGPLLSAVEPDGG